MIFLLLCIALVVLIIVGDSKLQIWSSSRRMINADWMDDAEKFELIARWGA